MLVSDLELITTKRSLFALPAKNTVAAILDAYVEHAERGKDKGSATITREIMKGVRSYFDEFLETKLLYK